MEVVRTTYLINEQGIIIMKIILSPAKKMNINLDTLEPMGLAMFIDRSTEIKGKSKDELKELRTSTWLLQYLRMDILNIYSNILGYYQRAMVFLKPMDEITPYRLEMKAKADMLYKSVRDEKGIIINLASKEYSKCIERYLSEEDTYIFITFCELSAGKLVTKGTYAKMARGEMIRFMTENCIENP